MAITTLQQVKDDLPGQQLRWLKGTVTGVAGFWSSYWAEGGAPAAGATPSSGVAGDVPTDATAGGMPFVNPAGGEQSQVARLNFSGWQSSSGGAYPVVALYDRLWHNSGISATLTSSQTINSVALTRPDSNGEKAEAWWHVYSTMGAGTPTVTLGYTNQAGTASRVGSSGVMTSALAARRTGRFTLNSGDTGVRSIQSWQASATFTSGTINLVMRRAVTMIHFSPYRDPVNDAVGLCLPRVYDDACLELLIYASVANALIPTVAVSMIQG